MWLYSVHGWTVAYSSAPAREALESHCTTVQVRTVVRNPIGWGDLDMNTSTSPPPTPGWEETRTEHFLLRTEPNSYAGRMMDELAERAEAAYQQGTEWFGVDTAPPVITLYLA